MGDLTLSNILLVITHSTRKTYYKMTTGNYQFYYLNKFQSNLPQSYRLFESPSFTTFTREALLHCAREDLAILDWLTAQFSAHWHWHATRGKRESEKLPVVAPRPQNTLPNYLASFPRPHFRQFVLTEVKT